MKKGFDANAFEKADFDYRYEKVEVKVMKDFFPAGEKPIFKVRNLTADEVARTNKATDNRKVAESLIKALAAMDTEGMVEALKSKLGYGEEVDDEVERRIELIIYGTVEPKLPRELVVKMGNVFPTAFYLLSNRITDLTGDGQVMGKPKPSGKTTE